MSGTLHPWTIRVSVLLAAWLLIESVGRLCRPELSSALRPGSWLHEETQSCAGKLSAQVTAFAAIVNPGWMFAKTLIDIVVFLLELAFPVGLWIIESFVSAVRNAFVGGAEAGQTLAVLLEPRLAQNVASSAVGVIVSVGGAAWDMPLAVSFVLIAIVTVCMVLTRALDFRRGSTATFGCALLLWTQTSAPQLLNLEKMIGSGLHATRRAVTPMSWSFDLKTSILLQYRSMMLTQRKSVSGTRRNFMCTSTSQSMRIALILPFISSCLDM